MMLANQIWKARVGHELDLGVAACCLGPILAASLVFRPLRWEIAQPDVMTVNGNRGLYQAVGGKMGNASIYVIDS